MVYFPVPHNKPAKPTPTPVRGDVKTVVDKKSTTPSVLPEAIQKIVTQTSIPALPFPIEPVEPVDNPPLPSKMAMLRNLTQSLKATVKSAATGQGVKLTKEEATARLDICRLCPFFRQVDERCSKCGCYMAVKTYLKAERCPIGKW